MANNRLFVMHRPTGLAICIGKRYGYGWMASTDAGEALSGLFRHLEEACTEAQDDFVLAIEDGEGAPLCLSGWTYAENKEGEFQQLIPSRMSDNPIQVLETAPVDMEALANATDGFLRGRMSSLLADLAGSAAWRSAYMEQRYGAGGGDQGHDKAIKAANVARRKVRAALGFYKTGDINV